MKIMVGLSGGVDSAVAAYLLKEQGHQVAAAFMRNWDSAVNDDIKGNPTLNDEICPQEQDYLDAKAVAAKIGIPLYRIDFIREYWDEVFATFLEEYKKGRTPNPDILCNKYIKFDAFFDFARQQGFDWVATGHYGRIVTENGQTALYKAFDRNKDQTYFLDQVGYSALQKTILPLGEIDKPKVRAIAADLQLSIAGKKDSTGVCFIGERDFKAFLTNYLPARRGIMIDVATGDTVGEHDGVLYYTIGQRRGLGIGGDQGKWYVVGKDVTKNHLYVASSRQRQWLMSDSCLVSRLNWLPDDLDLSQPYACAAKFRYRQPDNPVSIRLIGPDQLLVCYPQQISAVSCGQEAVFYQNDRCLGGGRIEETYLNGINTQLRLKEQVND